MKSIKIIGLLFVCIFSFAFFKQNNIDANKLIKILKVYETSIQSHVDDVVSKEYPGSSDQELIRSRKQVLLVNVKLIDKSVLEIFEKTKENKKEILLKLIDSEYRNYFPGLQPSFFDDIHKKVDDSIK